MPGLFEQFPHTNLHELNLDWIIDLINQFKQDLEDRTVISVNGMTGEVTLYESENVVLPPLTNVSSWRLIRMMDGQYVGVLFQDGHVWLQQGNSTLKLLTTEDIPSSAGVVSINGLGGVVRLTGADIPIDNSADPDSIRLALETEHTERVNADNALQNSINTTNQAISNIRNNEIVIPITTDTDLDTLVKPGYYNLYSASSLVNAPVSGTNRLGLIVQRAESDLYIYQMAFENLQSVTGVFVRACKGGTWSAWQQLALKSDVPQRTTISQTATNYTEVYEFPNGMVVLCARLTVSVSITNTSGGIYYAEVPAQDFGYTFHDRPTITATVRAGSTNGWCWIKDGATTTKTPSFYIGRGTSTSGTVVLEIQAIGYKTV